MTLWFEEVPQYLGEKEVLWLSGLAWEISETEIVAVISKIGSFWDSLGALTFLSTSWLEESLRDVHLRTLALCLGSYRRTTSLPLHLTLLPLTDWMTSNQSLPVFHHCKMRWLSILKIGPRNWKSSWAHTGIGTSSRVECFFFLPLSSSYAFWGNISRQSQFTLGPSESFLM